jgi:hypothetical protein
MTDTALEYEVFGLTIHATWTGQQVHLCGKKRVATPRRDGLISACKQCEKMAEGHLMPADDDVQCDEFHLETHLFRQREFSQKTFGPGARTAGVIDHIRSELLEIEHAPHDESEWIDVVILAFDGALRMGITPQKLVAALEAKQAKNEARTWPDWRTQPADKRIEHDRSDTRDCCGTDSRCEHHASNTR